MRHLNGVLALALAAPAVRAGVEAIELSPQPVLKWSYVLPNETWTSLLDEIRIPHQDGKGFAVTEDGPMKLKVDTNADGRVDTEVNGTQGFVTLRARDESGRPFTYPLRLRNDGKGWKYASGGVLRGAVRGFAVVLIDQDNDGRYDGYGKDAMVVGAGTAASYLSEVIHVGGDLLEFAVADGGRSAKLSPYAGPSGTIDLKSEFRSFGNLAAAVIRDGKRSFNVADVDAGGMKVPAGTYQLASGLATKGTESVRLKSGRMRPIEVGEGAKVSLAWGGPIAAEFDFSVSGTTITVQPNVAFYGTAGEEYHAFRPDAKSPKIVVLDKKTRKELASGRFGGC